MQLLVVDLVVPCDQAGGFQTAATYDIKTLGSWGGTVGGMVRL